jgi:transcriptional regulator with XRE-family HTH domain
LSELGREVRRLREEHGWTQNQLSVYAGVSQPTVNQIETGKRNPSTATVVKLAKALGVEISDLFRKASAPLELSLLNGLEDERLSSPDTITIGWQELYEMLRRVYNQEREPDAAIEELRGV